jgi:FAD-dependent urate hydroxylase
VIFHKDLTDRRRSGHRRTSFIMAFERALFGDFAEPVPSILGELDGFDAIHFAAIEEMALDSWARGRVLLLGDAAHATSPNMAEGVSMALEDGLVLARMLRTHGSPEESVSAFR